MGGHSDAVAGALSRRRRRGFSLSDSRFRRPSGSHVNRKRGKKEIRVAPDDDPGDVDRSWDLAEAMCAV